MTLFGGSLIPARRDADACDAAWHARDAQEARQDARDEAEAPLIERDRAERTTAFLVAALARGPDAEVEVFAYHGRSLIRESVSSLVLVATDGHTGAHVDELLAAFDDGGQPAALSAEARELLGLIAGIYADDYVQAAQARGDYLAELQDMAGDDYGDD